MLIHENNLKGTYKLEKVIYFVCVITFVLENNRSAPDIISLSINARGYSQIEHD